MDWQSAIWGGVITIIVGVVTAAIIAAPSLIRQFWDESIAIGCKVSQASDVALINAIGCAGLRFTFIGKSKRAAKVKGAKLCLRGHGFLERFQEGFATDFGHIPVAGMTEEVFFVELIPISKPTNADGWVLDRDDVCDFILPIRVAGLPLFVEAPSEHVSVKAILLDDTELVVSQGLNVQSQISALIEVWGKAEQTLKVPFRVGIETASKRLPDVARLVGTTNPQAIAMWKPVEDGQRTEEQEQASSERRYEATFDQQRMNRCVEVFMTIHTHSAEIGVFDCKVIASQSFERATLDDVSHMHFLVGHGEHLTELPFIDMLVVFRMIADQYQRRTHWSKTNDGLSQSFTVPTSFTETEARSMFADICNRVGIQVHEVDSGDI